MVGICCGSLCQQHNQCGTCHARYIASVVLAGCRFNQDCNRHHYQARRLLSIHHYWTQILPQMRTVLFVISDVEHLVTSAWQRLSENAFLLPTPTLTAPVLQKACASVSTEWRKIGEALTAACDVVPATVPSVFRQRFQELT